MQNEITKNILLVEDNLADIRLITETLKSFKTPINIYCVKDGVEAISFLNRRGANEKSIKPDIIILDLNLPNKNGFEVLKEIKEDNELKNIPTIILSISNAPDDIKKSYFLQANCYITKPIELDEFIKAVKKIEDFWLESVKLPDQ